MTLARGIPITAEANLSESLGFSDGSLAFVRPIERRGCKSLSLARSKMIISGIREKSIPRHKSEGSPKGVLPAWETAQRLEVVGISSAFVRCCVRCEGAL